MPEQTNGYHVTNRVSCAPPYSAHPPRKLYIPRQIRRRTDLTLCIAAETWVENNDSPCLVLCADRQIETPTSTAETALKIIGMGNGWHGMYSGDVASAMESIAIISERLQSSRDASRLQSLKIVRAGVADYRKRVANAQVSNRLAISYDEFLKNGRKKLPSDVFRSVLQEIQESQLGFQLILAGFAESRTRIFVVDRHGNTWQQDNFATIGTGSANAESMLFFRSQQIETLLPQTLYNVFEAKRFGESSPGVGKQTDILVSWPDRYMLLSIPRLALLYSLYEKLGPKRTELAKKDRDILLEALEASATPNGAFSSSSEP